MRGPLLVLTWIVATALATGLAWAGVRSVAGNVAAPLPVAAATAGRAGPSERPPTDDPSPRTSEVASQAPPGQDDLAQPQEVVRTFEVDGGTATVRFSPAGVEVLSAVPRAGFSADVESEDGGMRVEFESDDHRSRLDVWWNGTPRHAIEERDDNDDDGGEDDGGDSGEDGGDSGDD